TSGFLCSVQRFFRGGGRFVRRAEISALAMAPSHSSFCILHFAFCIWLPPTAALCPGHRCAHPARQFSQPESKGRTRALSTPLVFLAPIWCSAPDSGSWFDHCAWLRE